VSDTGAGEEEDAEKGKGQVPRMYCMSNACEGCCNKATGRQRFFRVSPKDHQPQGGNCNDGLHLGEAASRPGVLI
jgi:hypothetical protein